MRKPQRSHRLKFYNIMKYISHIFIFILMLLSLGCRSQQIASANIWEGHDMNVIDETFTGNLPCADCEKIDFNLKLKPDMTWHSKMIYVGKSSKAIEESGRYNVTEEGMVVLGKADEGMNRFKEVPRGLLMLDISGKEIEGAMADKYLLVPITNVKESPSTGHRDTIPDKRLNNSWVIIQLGDSILNPDNFMNGLPMIELSVIKRDISGHDGCNRIRGSFSTEGKLIKFGKIITTKMACPHKKGSDEIAPALSGQSFNYNFGKNCLILKQKNNVKIVLKNID
jgi:copper homeostasis protein (lipoprotein)